MKGYAASSTALSDLSLVSIVYDQFKLEEMSVHDSINRSIAMFLS